MKYINSVYFTPSFLLHKGPESQRFAELVPLQVEQA